MTEQSEPLPQWDPDALTGDWDDPGRHALPNEQAAIDVPTTSYGSFLEDPPYALEQDAVLTSSDAGRPPAAEVTDAWNAMYSVGSDSVPGHPMAARSFEVGPSDRVTCPECGSVQEVHLSRRDSSDFCRRCDFPLFWTPSQVTRDRDGVGEGEALRRLPGTAGRIRLASVACPHCAELNTVSAEVCVRCGLSMHPIAYEEPAPVYIPPPPPEPEPVIEEERDLWWVWVVVAMTLVAIVLIALILTHVIA